MNPVAMRRISFTSLLTTLLGLMSLAACDVHPPAQTTRYQAVFELSGHHVELDGGGAITWVEDKNGHGVKVDVGGDRLGTDADARHSAEVDASDVCGITPEVVERKVDSRAIYIVRNGCNIYDDYTSPISTNIYFEKEGWVVVIILRDDYHDHEREIAQMVSSLHFVPRQTGGEG